MTIKWFCKHNSLTFNGKRMYNAFPRTPHGCHKTATEWMGKNGVTFDSDNEFDAYMIDTISTRGLYCHGKILKVVLYLPNDDVYMLVDFRVDGLLPILLDEGITNGKVNTKVGLEFKGSNYYVKRLSDVPNIAPPVKKTKTKNPTPIIGQYYDDMIYMGQFKNLEDNRLYYLYGRTFTNAFNQLCYMIDCYLSVPKSTVTTTNVNYQHLINNPQIVTEYGSIKMYGFNGGSIVVDNVNKTIKFI